MLSRCNECVFGVSAIASDRLKQHVIMGKAGVGSGVGSSGIPVDDASVKVGGSCVSLRE